MPAVANRGVPCAPETASSLADRLSRLTELSAALARTREAEQVTAAMLGQALAALEARSGCVALLEVQGLSLRLVQVAGEPPTDLGRQIPLDGEFPMSVAARSREPVFSEGLTPESQRPFARARAALPLCVEDRLLGVLGLTFENPRIFDAYDRTFILALAQLCAQALDRVRLSQAEQQARTDAEAASRLSGFVAEASSLLADTSDCAASITSVARLTVPSHADCLVLKLVDDGGPMRCNTIVAHADPEKEELLAAVADNPSTADTSSPLRDCLLASQSVLIPRVSQHASLAACSEGHLALLRQLSARSAIAVPITARGKNLGTLWVGFCESGRHYGPHELTLFEELGRRIALAVDNARLYSEAQQARTRAEAGERRAALLAEAGSVIATAADDAEMLRWICQHSLGPFAEACGALLADAQGELRVIGAWDGRGAPDPILEGTLNEHLGGIPASILPPTASLLGSGDAPFPERVRALGQALQEQGLPSGLYIPVATQGRTSALLVFAHAAQEAEYAAADLATAEELAHRIAAASENRQLLRRAEESERRYRALANTVPDIVWTADNDGVIDYANDRFREWTGKDLKDFLRAPGDFIHPEDAELLIPAWFDNLESGRPFEGQARLRRADGSYRWMLGRAQAIHDPSGSSPRWIGAATDIEDHKRLESSLRDREEELARAVRARDDFLSAASHELKTPITSLLLQVESMRRRLVRSGSALSPGDIGNRLAGIERQTRRLVGLVDNLLDVSRITAGRLQLELEPTDLTEVVREVLLRFRDELASSGSALLLEADQPAVGRWDPLRLEQIATNIISNAIKYGQGKPVRITVATSGGAASLKVSDSGIGIAPEHQARIFERFERVVSTRQYGGFGLGLWIVRQIVEALGGEIRLESDPGKGSTFTVTLPLAGPEELSRGPDDLRPAARLP